MVGGILGYLPFCPSSVAAYNHAQMKKSIRATTNDIRNRYVMCNWSFFDEHLRMNWSFLQTFRTLLNVYIKVLHACTSVHNFSNNQCILNHHQ